ncbi:MAG: hypothetical protein KAH54_03260 [Candidatus Sabulitectum sp.]|nr:hypothetical protein [Candidatus Sabulitectum sp.]
MFFRICSLCVTGYALVLLSGCGDPPDVSGESDSAFTVDTLVFADTIGVLMGDTNYVFGALSTVAAVPGEIAVLDRIGCKLSLFAADGEFISSHGRHGSGPGEYSRPWSMCRLTGGEYLVFDLDSRRMTLLDQSMGYIDSFNSHMSIPVRMAPGADSMVVIKELVTEFVDQELMSGYRIFSLNAYTGEEGVVYREHQLVMGAAEVDLRPFYSFFTTDAAGNVYLAEYDSDQYSVEVVSPEGLLLNTVTMESMPRENFDSEIHSLIFLPITLPLTTESGTSVMTISYPEKQPYISDLAIDRDNNIWTRRAGLADSEVWDVISQEGELLRQVVLVADTTGTGSYPGLHVSPFGMAATFSVEDDFARFFTVEQVIN